MTKDIKCHHGKCPNPQNAISNLCGRCFFETMEDTRNSEGIGHAVTCWAILEEQKTLRGSSS